MPRLSTGSVADGPEAGGQGLTLVPAATSQAMCGGRHLHGPSQENLLAEADDVASTLKWEKWSWLLPWISPLHHWWMLQTLSASTSVSTRSAIEEALASWMLDPEHIHGGHGGKLLTEAAHRMIRRGATQALATLCRELRRRTLKNVPWLLRSRELVMYAAGHADSPASLQALLQEAPHALASCCRHRGFTLLHEAAFCGRPRAVKLLLAASCDAGAKSLIGETPLHIACHGLCPSNAEVAELLLAHDAGLAAIADESGLVPAERLRHALRRWHRVAKRLPTEEEQHAIARLLHLLGLPPEALEWSLGEETRVARDGSPYTRDEFVEHYGMALGRTRWEEAVCEEDTAVAAGLPLRCRNCGIRAGNRRTPAATRGPEFFAICGVIR